MKEPVACTFAEAMRRIPHPRLRGAHVSYSYVCELVRLHVLKEWSPPISGGCRDRFVTLASLRVFQRELIACVPAYSKAYWTALGNLEKHGSPEELADARQGTATILHTSVLNTSIPMDIIYPHLQTKANRRTGLLWLYIAEELDVLWLNIGEYLFGVEWKVSRMRRHWHRKQGKEVKS